MTQKQLLLILPFLVQVKTGSEHSLFYFSTTSYPFVFAPSMLHWDFLTTLLDYKLLRTETMFHLLMVRAGQGRMGRLVCGRGRTRMDCEFKTWKQISSRDTIGFCLVKHLVGYFGGKMSECRPWSRRMRREAQRAQITLQMKRRGVSREPGKDSKMENKEAQGKFLGVGNTKRFF